LLAGEEVRDADFSALVEQATARDRAAALQGSKRLFRDIVEPLADRFDPELSQRYVEFFSELIERVRPLPGFERFDERLTWARSSPIQGGGAYAEIDRCLVLSRVTLGADVAVTSVVLDGLKKAHPNASITLACGSKTTDLYRGDERLSFLPIEYERSGTLLERLNAWVDLSMLVEEWVGDIGDKVLLADPDSRLTQLGLLPAMPPGHLELSFNSRSLGGGCPNSISEVTSWWMGSNGAKPYVALSEADLAAGRKVRGDSDRPMATLNWGFGGNDTKRVSPEFETAVVLELLRRGWRVVLDKGFGSEESGAAMATAKAAADAGLDGLELFEGSLNGFAGIIAASDLFVGYDSGAGHVAAALGVPGIDVFRGAVCERMRQRWSPWGENPAQVIDVPADKPAGKTLARVVELLP
jgi:ADP-heptose:LPS heptosyltransferase